MSFFSKIVENNKGLAIGLGVATAVAVGVGILYKNYQQEENKEQGLNLIQKVNEQAVELNLENQIQKLKSKINLAALTVDDIKQVLTFSVQFTKKKILAYSKEFKSKRRQFNKVTRRQKMGMYLNLVSTGMEEVQNIGMTLQQQILGKIGVGQHHIMNFRQQLGPFMQQLMMGGMNPLPQNQQSMPLEEIQINYLKEEGNELIDAILLSVGGWGAQKKSMLPTLLAVVVADQAFEDHPQIDQQKLQAAEMKYQYQLMSELQQLQTVMGPLMTKISSVIPQQQFPGMGMGNGGLNPEQMEQLRALQAQDPAAFEQVMRMMQG